MSGSTALSAGVALQPNTQLWLFKDKAAAQPRTKIYLDGAFAHRAGGGQDARIVSNIKGVCTLLLQRWLITERHVRAI